MQKLANVALPVGVDSTFTYLIPPDLEKSAVIGARAVVPFGRRYLTGMIVELPASTALTTLKPIKDILDAAPVLSTELLRLCTWIADYYMTPLGEVIKAALPHGFASSNKRSVRLAPDVSPEAVSGARTGSRQREKLFDILAVKGIVHSSDLQKATGLRNINTVLNELEKKGLIITEEVLPQHKVKLKTRDVLVIRKTETDLLRREMESLSGRKKKARALFEGLLHLQEQNVREIFLQDFLKKYASSSAAVKQILPRGYFALEKREISTQQEYGTEEQTLSLNLNHSQQNVFNHISGALDDGKARTFLLHGVTGSGKTQVYIEALRHCLARNRTAVVLVPEISLTPQTARRFKSHFGEHVAVVHSNMSANERHEVWTRARRGEYKVVIGPRSAVFAPVVSPGLIIVDEEHEPSYKQFDATPRYNARDVAIVRGKFCDAIVVLGSATPSIESYYNAQQGKYSLLEMPDRVEQVSLPSIQIVNMTDERKREYFEAKEQTPDEKRMTLREFQQSSFSRVLREKMISRLSEGAGIILLQNRRGFAPLLECVECGHTLMCSNCNVTLTYHITRKHLRCHYCGLTLKPPSECPHCRSMNLAQRGAGTQRVEQEIATAFPAAKSLRMDMDTTTRKGSHERILRKFGDGEADILLGTQMVAKGLDFPRVTLVGVISADTQLLLPDFRASERTFQLLTQVAGRAGRSPSAGKGEVVIQTHQPGHYVLAHVVDHDYKAFFERELAERRELEYPPFSRLALVEFKGKNEDKTRVAAERYAKALRGFLSTFLVLGPSPAVISKVKNYYRWHIIIKSPRAKDPAAVELRYGIRRAMADAGRNPSSIRLIVDIDPVGLM